MGIGSRLRCNLIRELRPTCGGTTGGIGETFEYVTDGVNQSAKNSGTFPVLLPASES